MDNRIVNVVTYDDVTCLTNELVFLVPLVQMLADEYVSLACIHNLLDVDNYFYIFLCIHCLKYNAKIC